MYWIMKLLQSYLDCLSGEKLLLRSPRHGTITATKKNLTTNADDVAEQEAGFIMFIWLYIVVNKASLLPRNGAVVHSINPHIVCSTLPLVTVYVIIADAHIPTIKS